MPAIVTYNNSTIATVTDSATLKTKGTWLPYDIVVRDVAEDSCAIAFIDRTISSIPSSIATSVTSIGDYAFYGCSALTTASFPTATSIGSNAFRYCSALTTASFPNITSIGHYAFHGCSSLATASFPNVTRIGNYAFQLCSKLSSLYFMGSMVASLGAGAFFSTPMSVSTYLGYFGSIYVPASLLTAYRTAANWSVYSSRFVGV